MKAAKAWAVYDDNDQLVFAARKRTDAIWMASPITSWNTLYKRGYAVRKVRIEVIK